MKKRLKLFSTIASLCLAVALMAFGVWAATKATFKATSTVSFSSTTVLIDVEGSVAGFATQQEGKSATYSHTADNTVVTEYNEIWDIGALTFDETNKEITYTVKITNKSEFAIKVVLHDAFTTTGDLQYDETGRADFASIEAQASATYTLKVTLLHFDKTVTATDVNLSFVAEKAV